MSAFNPPEDLTQAIKNKDPRYLLCWTIDGPPREFQALLGPDDAEVTGGHGGWEGVDRPRRTQMTHWKGTPLYQVQIQVLFDGWDTGRSVEGDLRTVSAMGGKIEGLGRPPIVKYIGGVPGAGRLWVINDITRGDFIRSATDGAILRQFLTITFLQYMAAEAQTWVETGPANDALARHNAEEAAAAAAASRDAAAAAADTGGGEVLPPGVSSGAAVGAGAGSDPAGVADALVRSLINPFTGSGGVHTVPAQDHPGTIEYQVHDGDTLGSIAQHFYGNWWGWVTLAEENPGIDDPNSLDLGSIVYIPI